MADNSNCDPATASDLAVIAEQLGRTPRSVVAIAHRCPCGAPDQFTHFLVPIYVFLLPLHLSAVFSYPFAFSPDECG